MRKKTEIMQNPNAQSNQPITISVLTEEDKKSWTQQIWDTTTESKKAIREAIDDTIKYEMKKKEEYPELVEINGEEWKKALAATGQNYYFNTNTLESIWKLPEEYYIIDVETKEKYIHRSNDFNDNEIKNSEIDDNNDEDNPSDDEEYLNSENVEGYPNWKVVKMENGDKYYFNKITLETRWDLPGLQNESEKKTLKQLQNVLTNISLTQ